jgi:hypothetical protein
VGWQPGIDQAKNATTAEKKRKSGKQTTFTFLTKKKKL